MTDRSAASKSEDRRRQCGVGETALYKTGIGGSVDSTEAGGENKLRPGTIDRRTRPFYASTFEQARLSTIDLGINTSAL